MVPSEYRSLILLNPLSILMVSWRKLFMHGIFDFKDAALALLYSLIVLAIGYLIFRRLRWRFAEVL